MPDEKLEIISWSEYQKGIAPLWKIEDPSTIPIWNNPYYIVQYPQHMWHTDIILFPVKYVVDGVTVAHSCVYNIDDMFIRTRGIYVEADYRGKGYGHKIQFAQMELFPKSFYRLFGFWRDGPAQRFLKYSEMKQVPNTDWIWSDYSKINMKFLYLERGAKPTQEELYDNKNFIESNREKYSLGGTNNLNVDWDIIEWENYFETHKGNYEDLQFNLNF